MYKYFFICFIGFCSQAAAAQQIIVRLSDDVTVTRSAGSSSTYQSSNPEIQSVLSSNPPQGIKALSGNMKNPPPFLQNVQVWQFEEKQQSRDALSKLEKINKVIYAEPNHAYKVAEIPNDEFYSEQWYLPGINAAAAWDIEKGSGSVIVGVIDTGIDYRHEDLQGQLWINTSEDLNQNGTLDSTDINGMDEDNNGYADDVIGWDFTHAPNFPDQGDFLDPDNDPMDEYLTGHGTPVAGIINAVQNNSIGISGVAPNVKVMALRAGTASGFLEEDDVAEAIVYAVDNGCKIINMSFGDVAFSYLLHDAVQYGVNNGVLFVASGGNSGNAELQYPAGYDETISVGATTSSNTLAGFSSYGNKLNLVAPGQEIFSCQIDNSYGLNSGTSFSAPIVSAALALIWSKYPSYSPEKIKGALFAGCADLGYTGWDIYYGHGNVDVHRSLSISNYGFAEIQLPAVNEGISEEQVPILGSVFSPNLVSYSLKAGMGENPIQWNLIAEVLGEQVIGDTLAMWNTAILVDTVNTLELRLVQQGHQDIVFRTRVYVDHSSPLLASLTETEMLFGSENGVLIGFQTDDLTFAILQFGEGGSGQLNQSKTSPYLQREHYIAISQEDISGPVDYLIRLENSAGITSVYDNYGEYFHLTIEEDQPVENIFSVTALHSFTGYFLSALSDFNSNSNPEVIISKKLDSLQYGPLQVWEFQNQQFELRSETIFPAIPRDITDINGDGSLELLAGLGGTSMILEKGSGSEFPTQIAWIDSSNIWGSRLINLDGDPTPELLAIQNEEWRIFDLTLPGYDPVLKQTLPNSTAGNNQNGVPWSAVDDLDQDGLSEIIYGDYDGDILIFEDNGTGLFQIMWSRRFPGVDATYLFQTADVEGDGKDELIVVVRNEPYRLTESTAIARYWHLEVWQAESNNQFVQIWERNFQGINSQRNSFNGLAVHDIDGNGISEIYFTPFPRSYQIRNVAGSFEIGWYHEGVNANTAVQSDFDGNGKPDVLLNTNSGVQQFEYQVNSIQPPPPAELAGIAVDTNLTKLQWGDIAGANYYKVYRGDAPANLATLDSTQINSFADSTVLFSETYYYAVTQVNHAFPQPESGFSNVISIEPNLPPQLDTLILTSFNQMLLRFNEPMSDESFSTDNFKLLPLNGNPVTAIRGNNRRHAILSFKNTFHSGQNDLLMFNLSDQKGTPVNVDTLQYSFMYDPSHQPLYLKSVEFITKQRIRLNFSNPVEWGSASTPDNYSLDPDGTILSANIDTLQSNVVNLYLDKNNRMGSLGVPYYVKVHDILDIFGNIVAEELGDRLLVSAIASNLDNVMVYPNPYNSQAAQQPFRFANLPKESEIYIFNASGRFIRKLREDNLDGGVSWDLRTDDNHRVGSGVYFYIIRYQVSEAKGKFVIIN